MDFVNYTSVKLPFYVIKYFYLNNVKSFNYRVFKLIYINIYYSVDVLGLLNDLLCFSDPCYENV